MSNQTFKIKFKALTEYDPFPWQIALYEKWVTEGKHPHSCNLPTGQGKTSIIAIWLVVLLEHPGIAPRRLVYVVNRRTVVDQTTEEVRKIRENLAINLPDRPAHVSELKISTLRGQFADNQEWSADPSRPAVICGTVDMIGSRLLFSGYGVGFKAKPLHAGFLGQDVLLVHDEAHLETAFQDLLVEIEKEQQERERSQSLPWPKLRVMEMTATSRRNGADGQREKPFGLTDQEKNPPEVLPDPPTEPIHHVWRRLKAKKSIHFHENDDASKLPEQIVRLALEHKDSKRAILIFLQTVEDVGKVANKLPKESTERLTGTLRGLERDALVKKPIFQRFLPNSNPSEESETVYLVCTSAGEVGVNISADHLVCDLSTFESMTQRFGRVNRFGDCTDTRIDIVVPKQFGKKGKNGELIRGEIDKRREKTLELLHRLNGDASPWALGRLDPIDCLDGFAPKPVTLPVTDILFDAWALTTIREKLPARPAVEPYLHGVSEWQEPETYVAWREEVGVIKDKLLERYRADGLLKDLLDDYPLKPHELLRDQSRRVFKHLQALAAEHPEALIWIVDPREQILDITLKKLADSDQAIINYATVLLPPIVGGLTKDGMLDGAAVRKQPRASNIAEADRPTDANEIQYDVADEWYDDKGERRRIRLWGEAEGELAKDMALEHEIRLEESEEEDDEPPKIWRWYVKRPEATNEHSKEAYELQPHLDEVKWWAAQIVGRLMAPNHELAQAVILAAWCHDLGKRRSRWQRSLGNDHYPDKEYAKSGKLRDGGGVLRPREFLRDHYRHEFGSVLDLLDKNHPHHAEFSQMSAEMQDLVLHLIAAHHGRARPHFPMDEAEDDAHSQEAARLAIAIPQRFARLQRRYGRWGLAYLESLVRAADYIASANPDTAGKEE